ncbi:MAG: tripartite tricarboxylate transporter substrate binding protein [Treponema sp.]|nr:tripartite tricarboxylate transporter substrate binding protein [Treponema sp.]
MTILASVFALSALVANGTADKKGEAVDTTGGWPKKAINIVVPFAAGGNSDVNARTIAKYLTKELKQPVVITNVAGSGGTIGAAQVKNAAPDGYTVLVHQISMHMAQVSGMVDFGYMDFEPVCVFSRASDEVLIVNTEQHPDWNTYEDVVNATKKEPGKYKLTANTGASTQWIGIAVQAAGAQFNVVSSGGSGERLQLILGNHVDVTELNFSQIVDYVKERKIKILANVSAERSSTLRDVPTLKELGVDCGYSYDNTFFMPKGTDQAIVNKFAEACEKIITSNADYKVEMLKLYQEPNYKNPSDTKALYQSQYEDLMKIQDQIKKK